MTVGEAIEELQKFPQDADLYIDGEMGEFQVTEFKMAHLGRRGINYDPKSKSPEPIVVVC